ncbi:Glycosyltransferase, group 2 family protein [Ruminococcaceae bacterium BL-6]|nr:Glycosyltransferase, group 2 family protein [Ruminococcaceae bacterium BL-6]
MKMNYNNLYDENYYKTSCGNISYEDEHFRKFFENVADHIVNDFHPQTVLDVGCAMGYLVAALRDRGVAAYGIDVSKYAISKVREDIRPYCRKCSALDPLPTDFPKNFDLVTTIEVAEHLYEEDAIPFIQNICKLADTVIFSSTSDDFSEKTHVNVQQTEYWVKRFAKNGFYNQVGYPAAYISQVAMVFKRTSDVAHVIENYERNRRMLVTQIEEIQRKPFQWNLAATLYYDLGKGYTEESKSVFDLKDYKITIDVPVDAGVQKVRFDPVEGKGCFVEDIQAIADDGAVEIQNANGFHLDNFDIFINTDPQFQIVLQGRTTGRIKIKANIYPFEDMAYFSLLSKFQELLKHREEINQYAEKIEKYSSDLLEKTDENMELQKSLKHYKEHYQVAINQRTDLTNQLAALQGAYQSISNSTCWKVTKPIRVLLDAVKKVLKSNRVTWTFCKGLKCLKQHGVRFTMRKVKYKFSEKARMKDFYRTHVLSDEERKIQEDTTFPKNIKFSILVPLYNTPEKFLKEMIESVISQTYSNWELCLANGSDGEHNNVGQIAAKYAQKDSRIRHQKLEKNLGISENTNACIEMSSGDYIALLDHDDILHPSALFEVMKAICDKSADFIYTDEATFEKSLDNIVTAHFKPDFAIDNLRANNYICHFSAFKRSVLDKAGWFRKEYDGSQDHDIILRLTSQAEKIVHIPKLLYFWRSHSNSVAADINSKTYAINAGKKAVLDHLKNAGLIASIESSKAFPTIYRIKYKISDHPLISIIILNRDHIENLHKCLISIIESSTYSNYEIIIVENNSIKHETFEYYDYLKSKYEFVRIISWEGVFNYSAINNFGFQHSKGKYILLLNNDMQVITPNWIEEMLMFAQRKDVGAVGAKLYFKDNTIQHAGIILGLGADRVAGHAFYKVGKDNLGYMGRLFYAQDVSAVTGACMLIPRHVYEEINGLDDSFAVAFNDVDFCMRIRKAGYLIVFTPYAELYHYESKSRGADDDPEKRKRFQSEVLRFQKRWSKELAAGDPYYNPNLTLDKEDFSLKN